jgi:hypothetical protein
LQTNSNVLNGDTDGTLVYSVVSVIGIDDTSTESEYEVEIAPLELRNSDNSAFDFKYTRHVYTPLSLSSRGLIVRVDTNMAGVRAEVLLIENRWVSGIDSPSFTVHSTSTITGDVIEFAITEAHVREILSPVVTFPNGN